MSKFSLPQTDSIYFPVLLYENISPAVDVVTVRGYQASDSAAAAAAAVIHVLIGLSQCSKLKTCTVSAIG